ncbi:faciogenital dysplasia protein [Anaeramoeba flamelloides]|uniref:Faciogenital dysplasia protein n=1 Tax=Anaeramoeba flamelloides TaxID=1746091 RepID=A0AAV7Z1E8_9EUKA|nr:faciogenital dysplasia protein [Anaeramoeba flamelloides]
MEIDTNMRADDIYHISSCEQEFHNKIKQFLEKWYVPIKESCLFDPDTLSSLFLNIQEIYESQSKILSAIEDLKYDTTNISDKIISSVFHDFQPKQFLYFIEHYDKSVDLFYRLKLGNLKFRKLTQKLEKETEPDQFLDYFALPLSLMFQYLANLKSIKYHTDPEKADYEKLNQIYELVVPLVNAARPKLYIYDNQQKLKKLSSKLEGYPNELVNPKRVLLWDGNINRLIIRKFIPIYIFIFNDRILLTKLNKKKQRYHFQSEISLSFSMIADLENANNNKNTNSGENSNNSNSSNSNELNNNLQKNGIEFFIRKDNERYMFYFQERSIKLHVMKKLLDVGIKIKGNQQLTTEDIKKKRMQLSQQESNTNLEIQKEIPFGKKTNMERRAHAINELIETEKEYLRDLNTIQIHWYNPMKENQYVDPEDLKRIFSHILMITGVNTQILQQLEELRGEKTEIEDVAKLNVGLIFLNMADYLKAYTEYCTNYDDAVEIVFKIRKNSKFEKFEKDREKIPQVKKLSLLDFLIKPVQRVCKYPLIIKEILKGTEKTYEDYPDLAKSYTKLEKIAAYVNEKKKLVEKKKFILDLNTRISGLDKVIQLITPKRKFIWEGVLKKKSVKRIQERNFWLFNDLLLYAKSTRGKGKFQYKGHIKLSHAIIREPKKEKNMFPFQLIPYNSQKVYTIYCKSINQKKKWVKKITELIKDLEELGITPGGLF